MRFLLPLGSGSTWDDNESKYMLRSLDNVNVQLSVYSNSKIQWLQNAENVVINRYYPLDLKRRYKIKKYENYFDTNNKLRIFATQCKDDEFIYIYDDVLLVGEFQILNFPQHKIKERHYRLFNKSRHGQTIMAAIACLSTNNDFYNYETHLPRLYETDKVRFLYRKYPLENQKIPYSFATLYFNYFNDTHLHPIIETDNYKAGFYGDPFQGNGFISNSILNVEKIIHNKVWLNYNNKGLCWRNKEGESVLKKWIENKFKIKSRFEN